MSALLSRHGAFGLLLVACAILYSVTLNAHGMFMWDEAEYAAIARSLLRGEGLAVGGQPNHYRLPVLPVAAAASMALAGGAEDVVLKRASVAFALLALTVVYAFASAEHGRRTGLVAAVILALMPGFWGLTTVLLTEMPFLAFFAAALFALQRALVVDRRFFLCSGACAALALLTRYTATLLAPAALLLLLAAARSAPARVAALWRDPYVAGGAVLCLAILLPWLVRQQLAFGDALAGFRYAAGQLTAYLPGVTFPWYYYLATLPALISAPVIVLLLFGIGNAWIGRDRLGLACALVVGLLIAWFSAYRYKETRLVTALMPFAAVLAALALRTEEWPRARWSTPLVVVTLAVVAAASWQTVRADLASVTLGYPSFLDAMRYLRGHSSADAVVIGAAGPQIAWYADRRVVDAPAPAALPELLAHADWLVITNFERGQPPYIGALAQRLTAADFDAGAVRFSDGRYQTLLVPARLVRAVLDRDRGSAQP